MKKFLKALKWYHFLIIIFLFFLAIGLKIGSIYFNSNIKNGMEIGSFVSIVLDLSVSFALNISFNHTINSQKLIIEDNKKIIDNHKEDISILIKQKNTLQFESDKKTEINATELKNNGIIANTLNYQVEIKNEINTEEMKKCQFIIEKMDELLNFMNYPLNDPLNNYSGQGKNLDGTPNRGDYENLYALYDFFNNPSTLFNNKNLSKAKDRLYGAVAELYFDLGRYTHSYGREGKLAKDRWSLFYLISEHPYVYTTEEKMGEITKDVEKTAEDQMHKLQQDKLELEYAYKNFVEIYNSLVK